MALSKQLREELDTVCGHTIEDVITRRSPEDFDQIMSVVTDSSSTEVQRNNAIQVLGRWGDQDAIPAIVGATDKMDERGLMNVLAALGELGGIEAERAILRFRRNRSPDVRRFVAIGLGRIDSDRARQALEAMATSDSVDFVRTCAQGALKPR